MEKQLKTKKVLIVDISGPPTLFHPTEVYNNITELLVINKRITSNELDNIQVEFCAFYTFRQYLGRIHKINQTQTIVVNWVPGCRMAYPTTTPPHYQ